MNLTTLGRLLRASPGLLVGLAGDIIVGVGWWLLDIGGALLRWSWKQYDQLSWKQ